MSLFPMAQRVKNLPTVKEAQETLVQSLSWEDLLEEEMATHSRILAWKIPWTRSLQGYSPKVCKESDMTEQLSIHTTALGKGPVPGLSVRLECASTISQGLLSPFWASLVSQMVKNLPEMQETWVWSLGQEEPLGKKMTSHSNIFAWRIAWTEEAGGLQLQRVRHDRVTNTFTFHFQ